MDNPAQASIVRDVLIAIAANVVAFVIGYPLALLGPGFLIIVLPFGMFWLYVLLVVLYALFQFRKQRRHRAILTVALAAIVMIMLAMNLHIA